MASWDELAHEAFKETDPIQADATHISKYGAPAVAIVTAVLTALLGSAWNLDPKEPATLIAAAIIVAAVMLGVYAAFVADIHSRGIATAAKFDAIAQIRTAELRADGRRLAAKLDVAEHEREDAQSALSSIKRREAREELLKDLRAVLDGAETGRAPR